LNRLHGIHSREQVTVIGRGPSLLDITATDIGPGPVIAINHAILRIRELSLSNVVYSQQKDGCLVQPQPPEILLVSKAQSRGCFLDYVPRHLLNPIVFRLHSNCMSLTLAIALGHYMGCRSARLIAFDSYTREDFRTVVGDELLTVGRGYLHAANQAIRYAAKVKIPLEWE
jgi:hypothetical protein